jgi:hypothetical protein
MLMGIALAVVVVSIGAAIFCFRDGHLKHGLAFLGLAMVAGIGAWFASAPERSGVDVQAAVGSLGRRNGNATVGRPAS